MMLVRGKHAWDLIPNPKLCQLLLPKRSLFRRWSVERCWCLLWLGLMMNLKVQFPKDCELQANCIPKLVIFLHNPKPKLPRFRSMQECVFVHRPVAWLFLGCRLWQGFLHRLMIRFPIDRPYRIQQCKPHYWMWGRQDGRVLWRLEWHYWTPRRDPEYKGYYWGFDPIRRWFTPK